MQILTVIVLDVNDGTSRGFYISKYWIRQAHFKVFWFVDVYSIRKSDRIALYPITNGEGKNHTFKTYEVNSIFGSKKCVVVSVYGTYF